VSIAGFYRMVTRRLRLVPDFTGGGNMRTELQLVCEFYLLSGDGRVYHDTGDGPVAPLNFNYFDFDAASVREPANVGVYTVDGPLLTIRLPNQTILATIIAGGGAIQIEGATYELIGP
jgi:hypothetical protein